MEDAARFRPLIQDRVSAVNVVFIPKDKSESVKPCFCSPTLFTFSLPIEPAFTVKLCRVNLLIIVSAISTINVQLASDNRTRIHVHGSVHFWTPRRTADLARVYIWGRAMWKYRRASNRRPASILETSPGVKICPHRRNARFRGSMKSRR